MKPISWPNIDVISFTIYDVFIILLTQIKKFHIFCIMEGAIIGSIPYTIRSYYCDCKDVCGKHNISNKNH